MTDIVNRILEYGDDLPDDFGDILLELNPDELLSYAAKLMEHGEDLRDTGMALMQTAGTLHGLALVRKAAQE